MMQSLEEACEEGEVSSIFTSSQCDEKSSNAAATVSIKSNMVCTHSPFKKAKTSRASLLMQPNQDSVPTTDTPTAHYNSPPFCIHTKLLELYLEECANDPNKQKTGLIRNSHLLEKLVARDRLNTLILNLYPPQRGGYSLTFPTAPNELDVGLMTTTGVNADLCADDTADTTIETKTWPYEDEELLRYIDHEELPVFFVDLLQPHYGFLFYSGCIIAQIRDYRQTYPTVKCDISYVLLKPTLQSILADVNEILKEREDWDMEEKQQLESHLILANHQNLCLDPDSSVSSTASRINHNRQLFNTHRIWRAARRQSQLSVNRKRKLLPHTHRPGLGLYDYITRMRSRQKSGMTAQNNKFVPKRLHEEIKPIPVPNLDPPHVLAPTQGVHIKEFKEYPHPVDTSDYQPQPVEEYILETDMHSKDKDKRRVYHIKLSILQRPVNGEYLGELYLDRDHKKDESNGVACRFSLGTRVHANRYIQQFIEIFTEGGRKAVRINYGPEEKSQTQTRMNQQHPSQLNHTCTTPLVNGTTTTLVQQGQNHGLQQNTSVPILQAQLQSSTSMKSTSQQVSNQEKKEISALATSLMNSAQQFQEANAKQQQQKLASSSNNPTIINLLNSSPASNINSDASVAVVNAINNSSLLPHQVQTINKKLLGRKITLPPKTRVMNHNNLIAVNNNRLSDLSSYLGQQQQQGQTITLTTVNSGNFTHANYTTVPIKQPVVNQRIISASGGGDGGSAALSALLVGTPAANRGDILASNTNSLVLEKLAGATGQSPNPAPSPTSFIQSPKQFAVQSPKANPVMSPPPQQNVNTINVQSLNFALLQSLSGLQNVQVQLPGFSLPLNVSKATLQGHPTSLLVSVPVTTETATTNTIGQAASSASVGNSIGVATPTVVLTNAGTSNIAQLVTSGVKGLTQQGIRTSGPTGVTLTQGGQPFQLITPIQRPTRMQQQASSGATVTAQNITTRGLQRTPITIKMATPQANISQVANVQKAQQAQIQYQFVKQQQQQQQKDLNLPKVRRRSNLSEPQ